MNIRMWGFALSLTMTGVAMAQVPPPAPPPPPPHDQPGPPVVPGPENPPPASAPMASPSKEEPQADTGRPAGLAFGIGIGYVFPTSLQTPNTTSVRLRLPIGLTFEPQLVFATTSTDADAGMAGMTMTNKQNEVSLGSLVRYPLKVRNKIDLEAVGSLVFSNRVIDPNGDNNNQTLTTFALGYGVAIAYWLSPHWNLSLTASNPLFTYTRTRQEVAPDVTTVNKSTTIGLVFDPNVALMIHLYN